VTYVGGTARTFKSLVFAERMLSYTDTYVYLRGDRLVQHEPDRRCVPHRHERRNEDQFHSASR
jgi:adenosyl cobinamide kinase/adenosyl cobinamide phosphate guanylyltransferase